MISLIGSQTVGGLGACRLKIMPTVVGLRTAEGPAAECKTRRFGFMVPTASTLLFSKEGRRRSCASGGGIADSG